jgi:tetratricopeptide (TPR) repeat protein
MNERPDPNRKVDVPSSPGDSLDAGLTAGFGGPAAGTGPLSASLWKAEKARRRKVQFLLAAALVALLLVGGAFAWWHNAQAQASRQREARNAEAVAALMNQCEEALKADDAARAQVALEAAKERSAEGGAEEQAQRLGRLDADLALLRDLDAIDQFRWTVVENKFPDAAVVARQTREALRRFGADPEAVSAEDTAARVSASVVRQRIVSALDRLLRQAKNAEVRAVLRRVDADAYRDAVRDVVLANDAAKMADLAGQDAALEQPAVFLAFLGESPAITVERRRQLLQAAVSRRPGDLGLLMTLGGTCAIDHQDGVDAAVRWYQAAVATAPAHAAAHNNLGTALKSKGQVEEAIACFKMAIALDPRLALTHRNLGTALLAKGQVEEAIACYRKAIALDPKFAAAHHNLGDALCRKGKVNEAIACYKKALELDPKLATTHANLGSALLDRGQVEEAIVCFKRAIALDPRDTIARSGLARAERLAAARDKLPGYRNGSYTPAGSEERLALVEWCQVKKLHHAASRLYTDAFAAEPKLADDLNANHRYNAARHAALAAAGQGEDSARLDDKERTRLRKQALDWLRADLALRARLLATGKPADRARVQKALQHWQKDADLTGLRDREALAKLPAQEQKAFSQLWADVATLLEKAEERAK